MLCCYVWVTVSFNLISSRMLFTFRIPIKRWQWDRSLKKTTGQQQKNSRAIRFFYIGVHIIRCCNAKIMHTYILPFHPINLHSYAQSQYHASRTIHDRTIWLNPASRVARLSISKYEWIFPIPFTSLFVRHKIKTKRKFNANLWYCSCCISLYAWHYVW